MAESKNSHFSQKTREVGHPVDAKLISVAGYCIYRGTEPNRIDERINLVPFAGTECGDDSVEPGKKYYYAVRAITVAGITSKTSRPAAVSISDRAWTGGMPAELPPFCRDSR